MVASLDWCQLRQNMILATQRTELYNPSYWDKESNVLDENSTHWVELTKKQLKTLPLNSEVTVLDVGAGTGRMTLPMAKRARHVTALEPSEKMLKVLHENAKKQGISNIHYVNTSLEDFKIIACSYDFVVASFSLFMFDIKNAIKKMNAIASKGVYLFLSASPWLDEAMQKALNADYNSWSDFIFIYNILYESGIAANVEVWNYELKQSFADLDSAVLKLAQFNHISSEKTGNLRDLLKTKLVEDNGKFWYNRERKAAALWWTTSK
jgi:ubiquinone/menaquinone biosynthesis C-methylase UbiE